MSRNFSWSREAAREQVPGWRSRLAGKRTFLTRRASLHKPEQRSVARAEAEPAAQNRRPDRTTPSLFRGCSEPTKTERSALTPLSKHSSDSPRMFAFGTSMELPRAIPPKCQLLHRSEVFQRSTAIRQ